MMGVMETAKIIEDYPQLRILKGQWKDRHTSYLLKKDKGVHHKMRMVERRALSVLYLTVHTRLSIVSQEVCLSVS